MIKSHRNHPHEPTTKLLAGLKGVELGGAQGEGPTGNSFFLECCTNIAPEWSEEDYYAKDPAGRGHIDLYGHAGDIPLKDNRCDFVLSSHVIEHVPDPIGAFLEWDRVICPGGYAVMIVPQPDALGLDTRPLSTLTEVDRARRERWAWDYHPDSTVTDGKYGHYWKWDLESFRVMMCISGPAEWVLIDCEDPDSKVGNGFWVAYRTGGRI